MFFLESGLHHLVDFAPLLAVLGEGLAVVGSQLDCPLSTVIGDLDCSDKVSELDVVGAGVPLGGGQGQPVNRQLQDVEQFPEVGSDEVPQLSCQSSQSTRERLEVPNVSPLVLAETSLTVILDLSNVSSSSSFSLARVNRTVLGARNQRWRDRVARALSVSS